MKATHNSSLRLLTWLDVERLLKQRTHLWYQMPEGITALGCFAVGMDVYYSGAEAQVDEWLSEVFGRYYLAAERQIHLQIGHARYPVTLIHDEDAQVPRLMATLYGKMWCTCRMMTQAVAKKATRWGNRAPAGEQAPVAPGLQRSRPGRNWFPFTLLRGMSVAQVR